MFPTAARPSRFCPVNIVALDQEQRALHVVINGEPTRVFDPAAEQLDLPAGGGYVVSDANVWKVRNPLSQSQYCWESAAELAAFLARLEVLGYRALAVANKQAMTLYRDRNLDQSDAVRALWSYTHDQVADPKGRAVPDWAPDQPLSCGCAWHWTFDSGHPVRPVERSLDRSFGERDKVAQDFLKIQNDGGYDSGFLEDVVRIAWTALDRDGRRLFSLKQRSVKTDSPNRLMAVAVCTHDPATGALRTHDGRPWGVRFIVDRVIGLNGAMRGTGPSAPGNPMRAVLRILGRRTGERVDRLERAELDAQVRVLIRALQAHPNLRPAFD